MENKIPIDKKELLDLLKEHLVICVDGETFAPYYDERGYVKFKVSLNWRDGNELTEISQDISII